MKEDAFRQEIISTICKFFILRLFSNYFASGHGFQLKHESTNVTPQMIYRMGELGECGGTFTTLLSGDITSPSYPDYYPHNTDCIYTISQPNGTVIMLNLLSMDIENHSTCASCASDYLEIRDGPSDDSTLVGKLCGSVIPAPIQSTQNQMWMK